VCSLFQCNGFKEASECTKLSDDHLVVLIGGDKGGSVMQSKVGITVMNSDTPNTPENFDFIGAFDAKDTYYNLKKSIFSRFEEDLKVLCAEKDTSVSVISHKHDNKPVLARVSSNPMADPTNHVVVTANDTDSNIVFVESHFKSEKDTTSFIVVVNTSGHAWGFGTHVGDALHVVLFKMPIPDAKLEYFKKRQFTLHMILVSDIELTHTVMGLQTCSATNSCFICMIKNLTDLDSCRYKRMHAPMFTHSFFNAHLRRVLAGQTWMKRRKLAQANGPVTNEPLIPLPFWRVFPPGLHLLLEITKKLWDPAVDDVQTIEAEMVGGQQAVLEAFHNLEAFVKRTDAAVAQIENKIFVSRAQLQECTDKYQQALAEQHNQGDC
jgi:hypothetical protein